MISFIKLLNLGSSPVGKVEITDCNSIAELKAIRTGNNGYGSPILEDGSIVNVDGYYAQNDGGGGVFIFNAYSSAADDGGAVIAPTSGLGRWIRQMSDVANVLHFGAKGDAATDDTAAINNAATYARTNGLELLIPQKNTTYKITAQIDLRNIFRVRCSTNGILVATAFAGTACKMGWMAGAVSGSCFDLEIALVRQTNDWTAGNIGCEINAILMSDVRVHRMSGFQIGLYLNGTGAFSTNKFHHGIYQNNSVHIWTSSVGAGGGYNTESMHFGGYFNSPNQVGGADARAPFVFEANGQLCSNHKFYSPILEPGTGIMVAEALFTTNHKVYGITIRNARLENQGAATCTKLIKASGAAIPACTPFEIYFDDVASQYGDNFVLDIPAATRLAFIIAADSNWANTYRKQNILDANPHHAYLIKAGQGRVAGLIPFSLVTGKQLSASGSISTAHGDGPATYNSANETVGLFCYKSATPMTLNLMGLGGSTFAVVCWDSSGNLLSGTAPYYVMGSNYNHNAATGLNHYRCNGEFIFIHKDVARFFIGPVNQDFQATLGAWKFATNLADITVGRGALSYCGTEFPKNCYFPLGTIVSDTSNATHGWKATSRVDTTMRVAAVAGDTILEVVATAGMTAGDVIGVELDDYALNSANRIRNIHWTTIASITDGDTLVLTVAIPVGKAAAIGRMIYTNTWTALAL